MKVQMTVEIRMFQQGSYGNGMTLGDTYIIEVNTLGEVAQVLVKVHEACAAVAKHLQTEEPRR